ncbi:MAG TPA: VWA domain-containing protein [Hyphomicrobiaceae bacterium]|nr:VWA domain-containing protein [Hyphomicrobiaceae bacterium]
MIAKASAAATAYFDQSKPKNVISSTLQFSPNSAQTAFTVTATSWVRTPFLSALDFIIKKDAQSGAPSACQGSFFKCVRLTTTSTAELKAGGDGGSNVEVSLMLDATGSMCSPGTKIEAAQDAAKDLVEIVIWNDQSQYTSRIALAPFAEAVNVGKTLAPLVRGTVTSGTQTLTGSDMNNTSVQPMRQNLKYPNVNGTTPTWVISSKCVTERIGSDKYTDTAPASTSTYVGKGYFGSNTDTSCGVANFSDDEVNSVYPLSDDKDALKRRIDKLTTAGSTAGHLGTAWAWYLLSPKWNSVLSQAFPSAKPAGAYSDLTTKNAKGAPKLRKIAVLMTDGDYNINYCKGVEAKNSDQSPDINCNSENGKSLAQATSLCSAMKTPLGSGDGAKIEVFTVGFQLSSSAKTFLQNCATDTNHYYDAATPDALKAAFRDIAQDLDLAADQLG